MQRRQHWSCQTESHLLVGCEGKIQDVWSLKRCYVWSCVRGEVDKGRWWLGTSYHLETISSRRRSSRTKSESVGEAKRRVDRAQSGQLSGERWRPWWGLLWSVGTWRTLEKWASCPGSNHQAMQLVSWKKITIPLRVLVLHHITLGSSVQKYELVLITSWTRWKKLFL